MDEAAAGPLADRVRYQLESATAELQNRVDDQVRLAHAYAVSAQAQAADAERYVQACQLALADVEAYAERAARAARQAWIILLIMVGWTMAIVLLFTISRIAGVQ